MKVVYMGTPDFAVGPLEAIIKAGHEVTAVVTQPDKPKGRGKEMAMSPVKACAIQYDIPVLTPVKIKAAEAVEELKQYPADIFVVAAFGQILSEEILNMPKFGCINIHASLLPKYRGAAPIQWSIIDGEEETGITIMQMDKGLDTGDILFQKKVAITAEETGESLFDKLAVTGAEFVVEALEHIEKGDVHPIKQEDEKSTYAKMLTKSVGKIDWTQSAMVIERLIRGLNSWPSAYTTYKGKQLKIWSATVEAHEAGEPGTVAKVSKDAVYIRTGEGALALKEIQLEGKKRMTTKEFLLGRSFEEGEKLG
ncbi:MAG: methionyl-tRNA formyltransferase [Lachnospiraceae bacterium]|nr:methionyl-tRNA formyltransferase [Lachnospiraceae bacterium]